MKLYYSPFACSLATHIALREAGVDFTLEQMDLWKKTTETGADLRDVNPMGQVPTLVTDDGEVLTESVAVLAWISKRDSYEQLKWLSLVSTEVHKRGLALIFDPKAPEDVKTYAHHSIARPLGVLEKHLGTRDYLLGAELSVADAYLFWALTIAPFGGVSLEAYPVLRAYQARLLERPAYRTAVKFDREMRERSLAKASDLSS